MKRQLINLINFYQSLNVHSHSLCRFYPTCSEYTKESIMRYGSLKGTYMGMKRIIRCHPFGSYGYDPVPLKEGKHE